MSIIIRKDTGEYLVADPPHPRSRSWDDNPDKFFTDNIENAETFAIGLWADQYIYRCPPLCSLGDQATKRDYEHIIAYATSRELIGKNLPILSMDPLRDFGL